MAESPCQDSFLLQRRNRWVQQLQSGAKSKTNQHHPLGRMCVSCLSFELTYNESVQPSIGRVANLFKWVTHSRLLISQFPSQGLGDMKHDCYDTIDTVHFGNVAASVHLDFLCFLHQLWIFMENERKERKVGPVSSRCYFVVSVREEKS